ncbi:MAG: S1 RNA-binding domain-containing protein, partial [Oscillospiraceae bacterium]|nr:S1 RNA-binding domain-containing protein [Oscillospiraceae bacterium]
RQNTVLEARPCAYERSRGLIFELGDVKGLMPRGECAFEPFKPPARETALLAKIGRPVCFNITGFKSEGGRTVALLSRRSVQESFIKERLSSLKPGAVLDCRITHLARFGAFADLGRGVAALLPLDAISVSRIYSPADRLYTGEILKVLLRSRDELGRIVLSLKELLGSWEENAALFSKGDTVEGIVRSCPDYGVFIELAPNLTGLSEPFEGAREGMRARVFLKNIIPKKMKIKLDILELYEALKERPDDPRYFFEGERMTHFRYSPAGCEKVVETFFE